MSGRCHSQGTHILQLESNDHSNLLVSKAFCIRSWQPYEKLHLSYHRVSRMPRLPHDVLLLICEFVSQDKARSATNARSRYGDYAARLASYRLHPERVRLDNLCALAKTSKALYAAATPLLYSHMLIGSCSFAYADHDPRDRCWALSLEQSRCLLRTLSAEGCSLARHVNVVSWIIEVGLQHPYYIHSALMPIRSLSMSLIGKTSMITKGQNTRQTVFVMQHLALSVLNKTPLSSSSCAYLSILVASTLFRMILAETLLQRTRSVVCFPLVHLIRSLRLS